jgi:hypothetical protein
LFVGRRVEGLDSADAGGRGSAIDESGSDRRLLALDTEERASDGLRRGLDNDENRNGGKNDEGERGGSTEGEDEASNTCR